MAWAYATEQKLHAYLVRRFRTTPIEVTAIDCKTTFCEITGQSFGSENAAEFRLALADVQKESWSDFAWSSFSHNAQMDKVIYTGEVRRKQSYATAFEEQQDSPEQLACSKLFNRPAQQARETREAQPRDIGWADQMEQLLRLHLMTQLARHPVDQIDILCKTTFCTVKVKGRPNDSLLAVQKAMMAVESEPWADLKLSESGTTGYIDDSWGANYRLDRR